ncbi:hypothetical protein [Cetobacterium sp.]
MEYNNLVLEKALRVVKSALEEDVKKYYRLIFLIMIKKIKNREKN